MYEKKQLAFNFWCCALWSRKYGKANTKTTNNAAAEIYKQISDALFTVITWMVLVT